MSEAATKIEMARRAYVAAIGTAQEHAARQALEREVQAAKQLAKRIA